MTEPSRPTILVAGASIAGPAVSFFLAKAGFQVTVVERATQLRTAGQNIDIRGIRMDVIKRMGVEDAVRANTTQEAGICFVNGNNKSKAKFLADKTGERQTFTSDVEILRGELSKILYTATKDLEGVKYIFGEEISSIAQTADGLNSKTRTIGLDGLTDGCFRSLGQYTSYFSIPPSDTDGEFARWYNAPRRRSIFLRPDGAGRTRAFLSVMTPDPKVSEVSRGKIDAQKSLMRELFADAGWEVARVLDGMDASEDFYMQENAQIMLCSWSNGRVAVLGDAGYCPSPISGMGTTLALVGAYVLAGELSEHKNDLPAGLREYERIMRPFVNKVQKLPPGAPAVANPDTKLGISILNGVLGFVSRSGLPTLLSKIGLGGPPANYIKLVDYKL